MTKVQARPPCPAAGPDMERRHYVSSDGQFFRAGGRDEALGNINARHGKKPCVAFYTCKSARGPDVNRRDKLLT